MGRESPNFLPPGNENTTLHPSPLFTNQVPPTPPRLGLPSLPLPWRAAAAAALASGQPMLPGTKIYVNLLISNLHT